MLRFDAEDHEPEARHQIWREIMAPYNLALEGPDLQLQMSTMRTDGMLLRRMDSSPLQINRTSRLIRQDGLEHIVLHHATTPFRTDNGRGEQEVAAGEVTVNDLGQPCIRSMSPERNSVAVSLSRELVEEAVPDIDRLHGERLEPTGSALLASHMRALVDWVETGRAPDSPAMGRATALLLAAAARPTLSRRGAVDPARDVARLGQARRYIRAHLPDSSLDPEQIARALKVSRATLFRLFEPVGGVQRYVLEQRLARAHRLLACDAEAARVSAVAQACGFVNLAHFSRAFRAAFGMAPSEVQAGAGRGGDRVVNEQHRLLALWCRELG